MTAFTTMYAEVIVAILTIPKDPLTQLVHARSIHLRGYCEWIILNFERINCIESVPEQYDLSPPCFGPISGPDDLPKMYIWFGLGLRTHLLCYLGPTQPIDAIYFY
jgi:hypothetical protein